MKNKFLIEQLKGPRSGEIAEVLFVPEERSCYLLHNGETNKLFEYFSADDGMEKVNLYLPGGNLVKLDAGMVNAETIREVIQSEIHYLADWN